MDTLDRLFAYTEQVELFGMFGYFLATVALMILLYLIYLVDSQRKENAIKRDILRKKIGCSVEDFYDDVI